MQILMLIAGGLITIAVSFFIESQKRPVLDVKVEEDPPDVPCQGNPVLRGKWLRVLVTNKRSRVPFVVRQNAHCRASISFIDNKKQQIFSSDMPGRWANTPEPVHTISRDGVLELIYDENLVYPYRCVEIAPGETEPLDIVAKFDDDDECYGWNNESHIHNWRNIKYKLEKDWYIVEVKIYYSGRKKIERFRIINKGNYDDFRLVDSEDTDY